MNALAQPPMLTGPMPARRPVRKAVILAAGRGRRMGHLTADRPKAALEVGGHALVDWQIAALHAAGIEEVAIVTGHAPAALQGRNATYIHNPDWTAGTQVASLLCARSWIGSRDVIVCYGDILFHPCAPLALLERPGELVVAYDADHRWLWRRRFGDWLKDSETFRLGPGQVLAEIGGRPRDIDVVDGQFMGLMLLTPEALDLIERIYRQSSQAGCKAPDFTALLADLLSRGERIDTAANLLPWMEIDSAKDLRIARAMAQADEPEGAPAPLTFAADLDDRAAPAAAADAPEDLEPEATRDPAERAAPWDAARLAPFEKIRELRVTNAFAIQNWGRSGSTFAQSLFDDHPQVVSTPNFYSRGFYMAWARRIARTPDDRKLDIFLEVFRQWWDTGLVDATAGLHRLGEGRNELAGVPRERLEGYLRAAFATGRPITRQSLFEAGHLAYALARGQHLAGGSLQVLYPIHGEPRAVACALLEDFPRARFIHTLREPVANVASAIQHHCFNNYDLRGDALEAVLGGLFAQSGNRYGWPYTVCSVRPYLPYLATRDQARFLRLEGLHRGGASAMSRAASWLELADEPCLGTSTWDGKVWWNRPESGRESRLGGPASTRNLERLSVADRAKVRRLAQTDPWLAAAYPDADPSRLPNPLQVVLSTWRQEGIARTAQLPSLTALRALFRWAPAALTRELEAAIRAEHRRVRMMVMNSGAVAVRRTLAEPRRSASVRALLLAPPGSAGRVRAVVKLDADAEQPDRLNVIVLDETAFVPSARRHVIMAAALILGWPLSRAAAFLRVRGLLARLVFAQQAPPQPRLKDLDDATEVPIPIRDNNNVLMSA